MKKVMICAIALLGLAVIGLTSCKDDNKGKELDPMAKISIKAASAAQSVAIKSQYLSPVEVVRQCTDIVLVNPKLGPKPSYNYGVAEEQKDLTTPKIMMWGMWVVMNNQLTLDFIEAKDVILVTRQNQDGSKPISDTLAYIPNVTLREAETKIKAAYAAGNFDEVYRLFDQAYRFTPISGKDWLILKISGKN